MEDYPASYLYRRIVAAKIFMDQHFDQTIALDQIADEACFSKFHFIRLFKKIYGATPHQYLIVVRILEAKKLLSEGRTVAEACYQVGFESVGTFAVLFRRMIGMTPKVYQKLRSNQMRQQVTTPLHFVPNCFAEANGWAL